MILIQIMGNIPIYNYLQVSVITKILLFICLKYDYYVKQAFKRNC